MEETKEPLKHLDETHAKFCLDRVDCAVIYSGGTFYNSLLNLNVGNLPMRKTKFEFQVSQQENR